MVKFPSFDAEKTFSSPEAAIHSSLKPPSLRCLFGHLKRSQIYVCLLDFCFTILHVHRINLYKLTIVVFPFI